MKTLSHGLMSNRSFTVGLVLISVGTLVSCADVPNGPTEPTDAWLQDLPSQIPEVVGERSRMSNRIVGVFDLEVVNESELPFVFVDIPNPLNLKQEVIGGQLEIRHDGSYVLVSQFRDTKYDEGFVVEVHEYTSTESGTYSTAGFDIEFRESSTGYSFQGAVSGRLITVGYRGFLLTFSR